MDVSTSDVAPFHLCYKHRWIVLLSALVLHYQWQVMNRDQSPQCNVSVNNLTLGITLAVTYHGLADVRHNVYKRTLSVTSLKLGKFSFLPPYKLFANN